MKELIFEFIIRIIDVVNCWYDFVVVCFDLFGKESVEGFLIFKFYKFIFWVFCCVLVKLKSYILYYINYLFINMVVWYE